MYQNILLCTDGSPGSEVAADYAIWFAHRLGARLRALYVTDIRILEGPLVADISGALGAQPYSGLVPLLQRIQQEKASTTLSAVAARCQAKNVPLETVHETGPLVGVMLDHERHADLVVLGQRGEHAQWHGEMLGSSVERMLRATIKPSLMAAGEFRPIQHMLIAYDGSGESQKALRAGIDLAPALAVQQVTIVTVCQKEHEAAATAILQQGRQLALDRHVNAETQLVHGHPEAEILRLTEKLPADLLVMGAYGHTRIREFILGSTTSHVIRKARVPVLLGRS